MGRQPYRYRRCPECGVVFPAGKLGVANIHGHHWHQMRGQGSIRRCPNCGFQGFTQQFPALFPWLVEMLEKGELVDLNGKVVKVIR